ncbi:MAG: hypothetical protein HC906_00775 [Bacteroidales bacterium]|nr:hypothetical protein [Bacteroidales bacterium]
MALLHRYFAKRLKAAVMYADYLNTRNDEMKQKTLSQLSQCRVLWEEISVSVTRWNKEKIPYMFNEGFSYRSYLDSIDAEIHNINLN